MASVLDVAAYIVEKLGPLTAMKLQKLCYYSQAWSLVWDDKPLFDERIEAWANGPVIPRLYSAHRGEFTVMRAMLEAGDPKKLSDVQRETVDSIIDSYGSKSAQWLSDLTHSESPWIDARAGFEPFEASNTQISNAAMAEYYGSLDKSAQPVG